MGLHPYEGRGRGFDPRRLHFRRSRSSAVEHVIRLITLVVAISFAPMNQTEIETALELHQKAFSFLLDCRASGHAGSHPFDESTITAWRSADTCIGWITRHYDQLPTAFRPQRDQIIGFGQFLSSLFATSFSVSKTVRDGEVRIHVRALPTRRLDGSKKSNHAKTKERKSADLLRQHAIEALAAESEHAQPLSATAVFAQDSALASDLTLWAYAVQLVNRAHYASQGPAVYRLWLDLPEKTRRNMNADLVWQARQRLLNHLNSLKK